MTTNTISPRVLDRGSYKHGMRQWSYTKVNERNNKEMTISSAYHTYQIRIQDSDSSTVFDQKWDKMEERGDLKIDARKKKIFDLTVFIN